MARKIRGMTISIGADTSDFDKSIRESYDTIGQLNKAVKDLNRLIKANPNDVKLYAQSFTLLGEQIEANKKKLETLRDAAAKAKKEMEAGAEGGRDSYFALQREISATENEVKRLEKAFKDAERNMSSFAKIKRQVEELDRALQKNKRSLNEVNKALKLDPKNVDLVKQKQELLADSIDKTKQKLDLLKQAQKAAAEEFAKGNIGRDEYIKISTQVVQTTDDLKKLTVEANVVGQKFKDLSGKFEAFGSKASQIGSDMTRKISAPIIGGLGLATKAAADFEQAMAGVRKTTDMSQVELAEMGQEFRNIAKESPVAAKEIAGIGEMAGQLGVDKEHIVEFSKTISDLTIATNLTAEQGAMDLARFMNITGATFDETSRLGSAIVELGNNYATTETEILDMSTRLAAQATIAGLSSAETMGLATALSSVGLKAEAGGTSFSRLLQQVNSFALGSQERIAIVNEMLEGTGYTMDDVSQAIQNGTSSSGASLAEMAEAIGLTEDELRNLAVGAEDGQSKLETFASVAGMSAEEFAKTWKENPVKALEAFLEGVDKVIDSGGDLNGVFKDLGINGSREIDTIQRLASNHELLTNAVDDATRAYESNQALQKEVDIFNQTFGNRLKILKNNVIDLGISFGEKLIPHLETFVERLKNIVQKLDDMKPETMERLLKALLGLATIGPGVMLVGKLSKGLGSLFGRVSQVSNGLTLLKNGFTVANSGAGLFAKGLFALSTPTGLIAGLLGVTAVAAIAKLIKHMQSASVESDLFGEGISAGTEKALGGYLDLDRQAEAALNNLKATSNIVTQETADDIIGNFSTMGNDLVTELQGQKERVGEVLGSLRDVSDPESGGENVEKISKVEQFYEQQILGVQEGEARIKEILTTASNEKRALTQDEYTEISAIQTQMKDTAVNTLTASEEETLIIKQRMKDEHGALDAEMLSEMITRSATKRDQVIADANTEYDEQIRIAEQLRAEGGEINNQMADEIIKAAERKRDETVAAAEDEHQKVVDEARKQGGELVDNINTTTGEIKTNWELTKEKLHEIWENIKTSASDTWREIKDNTKQLVHDSVENTKQNFSNLKESVVSRYKEIANNAKTYFENMKNNIVNAVKNAKKTAVDTFNNLKTNASRTFQDIANIAKNKFNSVKNSITQAIEKARDAVGRAIDKIKGFFNVTITGPHLKLPHLHVSGGFSLNPPSVPHFSIEWYKKGAIFTKPTLFNTPYGIKGVGEAGAEAVLPIDKLADIFADTMDKLDSNKGDDMGVVITGNNFYVREDKDIEKVARELYRYIEIKRRGVGLG